MNSANKIEAQVNVGGSNHINNANEIPAIPIKMKYNGDGCSLLITASKNPKVDYF